MAVENEACPEASLPGTLSFVGMTTTRGLAESAHISNHHDQFVDRDGGAARHEPIAAERNICGEIR